MQVGTFSFTTQRGGFTAQEQRIVIRADLNAKGLQSNGTYATETPLIVTINYN